MQREMRELDAAEIGSLERAGHWTDYPIGVARELMCAGYRYRSGESTDSEHGAGRLGIELVGGARSLCGAGAAARPRH